MFKKIKRLILTVALAAVIPLQLWAQFSIGAKTGPSFNQFSQPGTTIGFSLGAYASYQVLPFVNVKFEPQYARQGGARQYHYVDYQNFSGNLYYIDYYNPSAILHNVELPLLAELTLPEFADEKIVPKLILGGSYSLMVKATESSTMRYYFNDGTPYVDVGYQTQDVTDDYKRNQFSAIAGLGVLFKLEKRDFQFDVRYRQGLTQLNQIKFPNTSPFYGVGGALYSSSLSINFSMTILNF